MGFGRRVSATLPLRPRLQRVGIPAGPGRSFAYDTSSRLSGITYRDGTTQNFSGFGVGDQPGLVTLQDGRTVTLSYDTQGRLQNRSLPFDTGSDSETFTYDGLDRLKTASAPGGSVSHTYSRLGTRQETTVTAGAVPFTFVRTPDVNGATSTLQYSDGTVLHHGRSAAGRLTSLTVNQTSLTSSISYAMRSRPGTISMGPLTRVDTYDHRRRLTSRHYDVQGQSVAGLRYVYDGADREAAVQYLHEGGRARLSRYDSASRLVEVQQGARPSVGESSLAPWSFGIGGLATWRAGDYGQLFDFDTGGADQLSTITTQAWPGETPVSTAQSFGTWDNLGHLSQVDAVTRLRDALGNTTHTQLLTGEADMVYDGANRLRRVTRTGDGTVVEYSYRADGVLARRQVVCGPTAVGCFDADRTYVYDGQLLLETWESGSTPVARYYYADEDDVPLAMDSWNGVAFERYYFVVDRVGSVLGLLNAQGAWVERTQYGVWGRPTMEQAELQAPEVHQIIVEPNGEMVVVFTEPVLPPPLVGAPGLVPLADLSGVMWLDEGGVSILGTTMLEEDYPGATRGSALRFVPNGTPAASGQVTLQMNAGALVDGWMNANAQIALQFMWTVGTPHTGPPQVTPIVLERSLVGNELGFQSHLMDDDVDLIHMRARVFDPHTGLFLQLDPSGYRDSVNLYAGLAWDTVNNRDPTGANVIRVMKAAGTLLGRVGRKVVRKTASGAKKASRGVGKWGASGNQGSRASKAGADFGSRPKPGPRNDIIEQLRDEVGKRMKDIRTVVPDARVGVRGSLARGRKGAHKNFDFFDPEDFDIDIFVVSDGLRGARAGGFQVGPKGLRDIASQIDAQLRRLPAFRGLRRGRDKLQFRIFGTKEVQKKLRAGDVQFTIDGSR